MDFTSGLNKLLRAAVYLRKVDKEMTVSRFQILLLVAKAPEKDGALVRDIKQATGLTQASVARNLAALSDEGDAGFVIQRPDPEDPRRVRVFLTNRGKYILSELDTIMD